MGQWNWNENSTVISLLETTHAQMVNVVENLSVEEVIGYVVDLSSASTEAYEVLNRFDFCMPALRCSDAVAAGGHGAVW